MAIVQISRIQHRRGLKEELPQLAAGELGWAVDSQELYIGNGSFKKYPPNFARPPFRETKSFFNSVKSAEFVWRRTFM